MKIIKRILFFLIFLLPFYGCEIRTRPLSPENEKFSEKLSDKFILDNGLVVVEKYMAKSSLVSMELLVKTGSSGEGKYLGAGISHFVEHMLFKGNGEYKAGDIARKIKELGGDVDGFTSYDCTGFGITVPRENLEPALKILADLVFFPAFDIQEFAKERNVILNEMRMNEDDPGRKVSRLFWNNAYQKHPYRHPVIGYPELFSGLTPDDLSAFHRQEYAPNNVILSIAGNFNRTELRPTVEKIFSGLKRKAEKERMDLSEDSPVSPRYYEESFKSKIMYALLGFRGVEISSKDLFALDVLSIILGEGDSSRLAARLKLKDNLVYSISSFNYTPCDSGMFGIYLTAEYKNKELIFKKIIEEIERIKHYPVKNSELIRAKNIVIGRFNFARETAESQAQEMASNEFLAGDPDFGVHYTQGVQRLSQEDLMAAARKYFNISGLVTTVLKPQDAILEKDSGESSINREDAEEVKLENGLILLLRKEDSLPIVSMRVTFLGGLRFEDIKKNGISNMCAQLLTKGIKGKTALELAELVESRGGSLGSFSGNNSLGVYLNLLSEDAVLGIKILSDIIRFPSFDESELNKEKERIIAAIKSESDEPYSYAFKLLKKKLFLAHPYGMDMLGEIDTVEALTVKDIKNFFQSLFAPSNCVISVFGNFDREKVIKEIKDRLLSLNLAEPHSSLSTLKEEPILSGRIYSEETGKKQAIICLGFHAVSLYDSRRYAFEVLNEILNGQGSRIFEKIREQSGLAYAAGTTVVLGLEPGYFTFYAATSSSDTEKIKKIIFDEIKNMGEKGFSNEEIDRAKASLVGSWRRNLETNSSFSLTASLDAIYGLGFDNYKRYENGIRSVTGEDLVKIVREYFGPDNYALIELIP